jgi:mono/diheme cytochrome c family protein
MKPSKATICFTALQAAVLLAGLLAAASTAPDDNVKKKTDQPVQLIHSLTGPDLYRGYCASCHGTEGKGDGPVASVSPPDFLISQTSHSGTAAFFPQLV